MHWRIQPPFCFVFVFVLFFVVFFLGGGQLGKGSHGRVPPKQNKKLYFLRFSPLFFGMGPKSLSEKMSDLEAHPVSASFWDSEENFAIIYSCKKNPTDRPFFRGQYHHFGSLGDRGAEWPLDSPV